MTFLQDISSASPVTGLLQATHPDSLAILNSYCEETIDLRQPELAEATSLVQSEFPALWKSLMEIMSLEKTLTFLPADVSEITRTLIKITSTAKFL